MKIEDPELLELPPFSELNAVAPRSTGTVDDDDEPDDERPDENEVPIRETSDTTEAPEEFELDDEDTLGHPEDDAADEEQG
ncbi:MAG TPA: hypothetical protein VGI90_03270 [Steroidobacteraceae bacterium]|jgi:hypothetical protein